MPQSHSYSHSQHGTHYTRSHTPVAPLPPSPSFVAILLVVRSLSLGPRVVFHYPVGASNPAPASTSPSWFHNGTATSTATDENETDSDDSRSSNDGSSDAEAAAADVGSVTSGGKAGSTRGAGPGGVNSMRGRGAWKEREVVDTEAVEDDETNGVGRNGRGGGLGGRVGGRGKMDKEGREEPEWERVVGFGTEALAKMLAPGKSFNKRKFEIGCEGLVFVGSPMFSRDDRGWSRRARPKKRDKRDDSPSKAIEAMYDPQSPTEDEDGDAVDIGKMEELVDFEYPVGFEPAYGHGLISGAPSEVGSDANSDGKSASTNGQDTEMTMFNVVFVLNPPALEYQLRVKEMYDNVVKKLSKALKYEQAKVNYVWEQSKKILAMKSKAKENKASLQAAWHSIIAASPLAKALAMIYDSISVSKIAHVHFSPNFETSFQIPQVISTPYIPSATEPQMPGLWLTTANVVEGEDLETTFTQHAALLLLEDPETLIREIDGDAKEHATPLAVYIRTITPTKSLQKLSIAHSIPASDMGLIAGHLCYWRRARLIPPLHQQNTYIVSPNANMRDLKSAIPAYAARFPTLPSLLTMLHTLSNHPIPYARVIPTRDHRPAYIEILAWLMRGGWVTQLRTFAWVRVSAEVKKAVHVQLEREEREKREAAEQRERDSSKRENASPGRGESIKETRSAVDLTDRRSLPLRISSPLRHVTDASNHNPSTPQRRRSLASPAGLRVNGNSHAQGDAFTKESLSPSIIPSPRLAGKMETLWLEYIGSQLTEPRVREMWPLLIKYFDGKNAIEDIALREGLKRRQIWDVWNLIKDADWLVCVRHW